MNIKISFFSCFRQKFIFLYVRKIPPAHTQTKIETKMGRRKKNQRNPICEVKSLQERIRRIYTMQEIFQSHYRNVHKLKGSL